jgi:hypothetical protein
MKKPTFDISSMFPAGMMPTIPIPDIHHPINTYEDKNVESIKIEEINNDIDNDSIILSSPTSSITSSYVSNVKTVDVKKPKPKRGRKKQIISNDSNTITV